MLLNSIIRALTLAQLKEVVCAYSSEMASASGYRESLSKGCHDVSDIGTSRHAIQSQNLNKLKVLFLGIFLKFVLNLYDSKLVRNQFLRIFYQKLWIWAIILSGWTESNPILADSGVFYSRVCENGLLSIRVLRLDQSTTNNLVQHSALTRWGFPILVGELNYNLQEEEIKKRQSGGESGALDFLWYLVWTNIDLCTWSVADDEPLSRKSSGCSDKIEKQRFGEKDSFFAKNE